MAVKNPTAWAPPAGIGYVTPSTGDAITTQSGVDILTQLQGTIIINPNTYSPKYQTAWTSTAKNLSQWSPIGGLGYVLNQGTLDFVDNLGNFIVDNSGNNIVTTPSYTVPKYATAWTGAEAS